MSTPGRQRNVRTTLVWVEGVARGALLRETHDPSSFTLIPSGVPGPGVGGVEVRKGVDVQRI